MHTTTGYQYSFCSVSPLWAYPRIGDRNISQPTNKSALMSAHSHSLLYQLGGVDPVEYFQGVSSKICQRIRGSLEQQGDLHDLCTTAQSQQSSSALKSWGPINIYCIISATILQYNNTSKIGKRRCCCARVCYSITQCLRMQL